MQLYPEDSSGTMVLASAFAYCTISATCGDHGTGEYSAAGTFTEAATPITV